MLLHSNRLDWISNDPDIELLESRLQPLFELNKELPACGVIIGVHKDADKIVAVHLGLILPGALNGLGFTRDGAKTRTVPRACRRSIHREPIGRH